MWPKTEAGRRWKRQGLERLWRREAPRHRTAQKRGPVSARTKPGHRLSFEPAQETQSKICRAGESVALAPLPAKLADIVNAKGCRSGATAFGGIAPGSLDLAKRSATILSSQCAGLPPIQSRENSSAPPVIMERRALTCNPSGVRNSISSGYT